MSSTSPSSAALAALAAITALVALVSWWRTRALRTRGVQAYFLADRRLPWIQVAGSLLLTNLSTEQLVGLNGAAAVHGAVVMAWEIVPVFALLALAWFFLPRYWSGHITTVPEFLERRFDRTTRRLMSIIFLLTIALNVLPFVLFSGGVALQSVFGLEGWLQLPPAQARLVVTAAIAFVGCAYVVLGGMKAVALSDTLYGGALLVAGMAVPVLALRALGGGDIAAGWARVLAHQAAKLNPIGGPTSNVPFSTLFTGMLLINLFYWCTNQVIVQRTFGAASFAEAQKGVLATAALKLLGPCFLVFPGIIAAEMFGAGIGNGDMAYPHLLQVVLPGAGLGIFAAIMLGSILSAFNGGLHSAATLFSLDLFRGWLRPAATEAATIRAGRISAVVVCLVALGVSATLGRSADGVFTEMKRMMAGLKLPLLAVVVMGMTLPRVPAWAAKVALVGGVATHFLLDALLARGRFGFHLHWLHVAALNTVLLCGFLAAAAHWAPRLPPLRPAMHVRLEYRRGIVAASLAVAVLALTFNLGLWVLVRSR